MTLQTLATEDSDRDCIHDIIRKQAEAWNSADAASFAERYREDGGFTNILGTRAYGKEGFVNIHAQIFRTVFAGSHIAFTVDRIHFLRPDVVVVDIDATLSDVQQVPAGVNLGRNGPMHSRLQEVFTKEDDRWCIAAFHNVSVAAD